MLKSNHLTVFVGDVNVELSQAATHHCANAYLVNHSNYKNFLTTKFLEPTTVYTALGDLPKDPNILCAILDKADNIIYCPPVIWSDGQIVDLYVPDGSVQGATESLLTIFSKNKNNVTGLSRAAYINTNLTSLADIRVGNDPQLWVAGCSIPHGVGVNKEETFGYLVAKIINKPVSYLTAGGSSIEWSADQILRSDIRSGDIVIWGLTHEARTSWWNDRDNKLQHATIRNISNINLNIPDLVISGLLTSKTQLYRAVIAVHQVVNFCKKINAKLFVTSLISSEALILQLESLYEFTAYKLLCYPQAHVDFGSDNSHPGPIQHQLYAEFCLTQLKNRLYI